MNNLLAKHAGEIMKLSSINKIIVIKIKSIKAIKIKIKMRS